MSTVMNIRVKLTVLEANEVTKAATSKKSRTCSLKDSNKFLSFSPYQPDFYAVTLTRFV